MRIFDSQFWQANGVLTLSKRSHSDATRRDLAIKGVDGRGPNRVLNVLILTLTDTPRQV